MKIYIVYGADTESGFYGECDVTLKWVGIFETEELANKACCNDYNDIIEVEIKNEASFLSKKIFPA